MSFSPVPRYSFHAVIDIGLEFLQKIGVKFLMLDLDNTIAAYGTDTLSAEMAQWAQTMKSGGIELFIISNTHKKERVAAFAKELSVEYVWFAKKPLPRGVRAAMESAGYGAHESALAGDQIFTDTLAANFAGVTSIIVKPVDYSNPILAFRYFLEKPFRAVCKNRMLK